MKILDRYITRVFLVNIVTLYVVLFSFVVAVDVMINLSRFTNRAEQIIAEADAQSFESLRRLILTGVLIIDLWGPRLLQLYTYLNGMVLIVAMGFSLIQMVRHRELVALLASGVSLHRVARPFLVIALVMIGVQAVVQERLIPPIAHLLTRDPGESGKREVDSFPVLLAPDGQKRLWYADRYDDATQELTHVRIWERKGAQVQRILSANSARWDGSAWELSSGRAVTTPMEKGASPGQPQRVDRVETDLDPTQLKVRNLQGFAQSLSWSELRMMRDQEGVEPGAAERLDLIRWGRVAGWVSNFLAFWAALPFFLIKTPRPTLGACIKVAPIALGGLVASAIASNYAAPGLPIWLGAFIPSMVLLSIAVAVYTAMDS